MRPTSYKEGAKNKKQAKWKFVGLLRITLTVFL